MNFLEDKLPKELTTVTAVSKYLTLFLFLVLPFLGFFLGAKYEEQFTQYIESRTSVDRYLVKSPATNTQNNSLVNWKTYRNEEFGFEVKHPTDWIVEVDELFPQIDIKSSKTTYNITILENDNPDNLLFDEWMKKVSLLADNPLERPVEDYAISINGAKAYRFDSTSLSPPAQISEVFIESPTKRIFNVYMTSTTDEDRDIVNQVLSTFIFTS